MSLQHASSMLAEARQKQNELITLMKALPRLHAVIQPDAVYTDALQALCRNDCNIAFCGKTNAGKSSLINALLGRQVLPVGDRPLSSEIVEIMNCASEQQEHFRIIFRDGSEQIFHHLADLSNYAAETQAEPLQQAAARTDFPAEIAKIRLVCHLPALPQGIRIIDTPGVGSSYLTHSATAHLYLEQADAVVYVLKSNAPLNRDDEPLLQRIQRSNRNIIVAQSASDMRSIEENTAVANSNKALLQRLGFPGGEQMPYYILSAEEALLPEEERIPAEYIINEYEAFRTAWFGMMYKTAGHDLLQRGLAAAGDYIDRNLQALRDLYAVASAADTADRLCYEAADGVLQYRREWMGNGVQLARLSQELYQAVAQTEPELYHRLNELQEELATQIEQLTDNEEAKALSAGLSDRLNAVWLRTESACEERINRVLTQLGTGAALQHHVKLTKNGFLLPFTLSEFGKKDIAKIVWGGIKIACNVFMGDVVGAITNIGHTVWFFFRRIAQKTKQNNLIKQTVINRFQEMFATLQHRLKQNFAAENGILNLYYAQALRLAETSILQHYRQLAEKAAEVYALYGAECEEKERFISLMGGEKGIIAAWQHARSWVQKQHE